MIAWAAQRPAVAWSSAVAIVLAGAVALARLPLATRPTVELPRLRVTAQWPGAAVELVESYLTVPLEAAVQSVRGVRRVDSESDEGRTDLTVNLDPKADVQLTRLAILERLELLREELPEGASPPAVGNYVPTELAEQPLLRYTLSGPYTAGALARLAAEKLAPRVAAVSGVAGVGTSGGAQAGVSVTYDARRLRQLGISPDALAEPLRGARQVRPIGIQRAGATERPVIVRDQPADLEALGALPVRGPGGSVIRLGDVASVRLEEDARDQFYRLNGVPAVALSVSRHPGADAIRTAARVRARLDAVRGELPPGVVLGLQSDDSAALRRQLANLAWRGAAAAAAVLVVLLLGLRHVASVGLVLLSALVAVAGTALGLYLLRIPANLLTLAGLGMGIGILVQNGVIVVDRLRGVPDDPAARAEVGRRITPAVLGATLTTSVVLLPFVYLQGNARAAFLPFAVAFALALGWSVVSSVVLIPAVARGHSHALTHYRRIARGYRRTVIMLLRWRWASMSLAAALVGVAAWGFATKVPRSSFGAWYAQRETLTASLTFPRGSDPATLDAAMRDFEAIAVRQGGVEQVSARGWRDGAWMSVTFAENAGVAPFLLEEELTRRAILVGGAAVGVHYQGPGYFSGGGGGVVSQRIKLLGYSYEELHRIALDLKRRLERIPRVRDVDINAGSFWGRERAVDVTLAADRGALGRFGMTAADLARAVGREVGGAVGGQRLVIGGEELPVFLKAAGARDRTLDELRQALVPAARGAPVRVGDVAALGERETVSRISRQDQQYVRILSYEFRGPARLAERTHRALMRSIRVPPGYSVSDDDFYWGEDESTKGLWLVFGIGVALVVLAVAMVFDSLWATAIVFLGLPLALAGSAVTFWIAGVAFSREAAVGVVLVVGLAVNQVILLVDAALLKRRGGGPRALAPLSGAQVVTAARDRARMIVLVTLTALASLIPLAVGADADELFGAIALATIGGTVAGTIGALVFVPALLPQWRLRIRSRTT